MEYIIVVVLILLSALFSGLTLGLMGLNAHELKRKLDLGDEDAARVYSVRKQGNLLLTTLLVGNVAVNATLSIFLGTIAPGVIAGLIATALIVVFGEIIPQAIFSRFALKLGAKVAWLVQLLLWLLYPVCKPIAWVLDKTLGDELPTVYSKHELIKIIEEHEDTKDSDLDEDEERIIKGALTFSDKKVRDILTPRTVVHSFAADRIIDDELIKEVRDSGFSRFPVYGEDEDDIVGIFYSSQLIGNENIGKEVGKTKMGDVHLINIDASLDDVLRSFLKGRRHLGVVRDEFGGVAGVLSLEDVLEEILRAEIVDESDQHTDMRDFARKSNKA